MNPLTVKIVPPKGWRLLKRGETFWKSDKRVNLETGCWDTLNCGPGTYTYGMFIRRIRRKP